ncbi:glucokinase [Luteimonas sp. RD2P54]|uniref:Glucokinase n=1 Tax=Luteimonas endophytica TaxID=3042023 RepID=A0ABT6JDW1_9GAMM|nr:glucokinase [Luteimonas endophytica]MDH5825012.1 glucokinase [Luteimonas endophytica]
MSAPFVSADIGGTNARLAWVRACSDGRIEVLAQRRYLCAQHPSLRAILADFMGHARGAPALALAVAGLVDGDRIFSRNVPWPIDTADLRAVGFGEVAAVNDFVAVAHAWQCMNEADTVLLTPRAPMPPEPGTSLLLGPGTGLGGALRVTRDGRTLVLPCEPQQVALAPGNLRELAVLGHWMRAGAGHVGVGHAVSGPGLANLYRALCAIDGARPRWRSSDQIVTAADDRADAHAIEAIGMFCGLLGSVVGDLAMVTAATRVFVAGGVPSKIRGWLLGSTFAQRLVDKDVMRPVLERIPVRLIEDPALGVIGAASWFVQRG